MSEMINNREYRQKVLKELIMELHNGKGMDEVKQRFEKLINDRIKPNIESFQSSDDQQYVNQLLAGFNILWEIDKHYSRKENLLFPYLEKYGITAPPKVRWRLPKTSSPYRRSSEKNDWQQINAIPVKRRGVYICMM